jgi:hypothetical protein
VLDATPANLTEFVIWLCNPYREIPSVSLIQQQSPLTAVSVNLILQVVGAFYRFLVRRGRFSESPVSYVDVPRGKWLTERDLLAHTRRGQAVVQRMKLRLKEPARPLPTISEQDFYTFIEAEWQTSGEQLSFQRCQIPRRIFAKMELLPATFFSLL